MRVLVVDDQEVALAIAIAHLRNLGVARIYSAPGGVQALEIVRQARPHIAVVDLHMADMDGMELIRRLARLGADAPCVIIASSLERKLLNSVRTMAEAYGMRVLGAIEKPITRDSLRSALERFGDGGASPHPLHELQGQCTPEDVDAGIEREEFDAFLQPKVDVATRTLVGVEALARWQHPGRGLLAPASFIPVLEKSSRLDALTFYMVRKAARLSRRLREKKLDVTVSLNLSLVSLTDTAIAERITRSVRDAGSEPSWLVLEITETAAMTEEAPALENLARLRMNGFGLAVDDYGTGFSSLRQLTRVPFTELKVDREFVAGCARNATYLTIVESSLSMAQKLEMTSTAEGVENEDDMAVLARLGCDNAQGYLIDPPLEEGRFLEKYAPV